ncbi:hypothetical protein WICMUC_005224 [Wickerhamomyces mucosus]|uniref:Serine/threonine-protein kinase MEC1 n=1 Tax=Wickerhamomyces mucosus TaxID=1378264 RepID=A0A9P8PAC2_9ASCO|nr:hypothetical protein WICMUC_005224 [Wickerhamomyces mucosus]
MNGSNIAIDALKELVEAVINGDTQQSDHLKVLNLIVKHGIRSDKLPSGFKSSKNEWLSKCLVAMDTIIEKDIILLIQQSDEPSMSIYKWIVTELIPLLSNNEDHLLLNVKQVIITIIISVSTTSKTFRCKLDIRKFFIQSLEQRLDTLKKVSLNHIELLGTLSICCNLFFLLTDFELRRRLMLDSSYDQVLESAARTIDFIMKSLTSNKLDRSVLEKIKSKMILYCTNYSVNDQFISLNKLNFLLEYLHESIYSPLLESEKSTQVSLAHSLLKVYQICLKLGDTRRFINGFQFDSVFEMAQNKNFIPVLTKSLNFIKDYQRGIFQKNPKFDDNEFDSMIHFINEINSNNSSNEYDRLLFLPDGFKSVSSVEQWSQITDDYVGKNKIDKIERYLIINSIGDIFCLQSGSINKELFLCEKCSSNSLNLKNIRSERPEIPKELIPLYESTLKMLLKDDDLMVQMALLLTIYKIFMHYQPTSIKDKNPIYKYILKCLRSSNRDLRMLSIRILPHYMNSKQDVDDFIPEEIFSVLESFDLVNKPHLAESTIMTWSALAINTDREVLHPILLKLVNFLGSSNTFQSAIAFHELQIIALTKSKTPWQLLSPIMDSLSLTIAQQYHTKPLLGKKISLLVGLSVETILSRASAHIIPYSLTYYKNDIIGKIAEIQNISKIDLILKNRSRIFAVLLTTVSDINENKLMSILRNAAPQMMQHTVQELITINPTIWETLKLYSPNAKNEALIKKTLNFILKYYDSDLQGSDALNKYFQTNILALIQYLSDTIRNIKGLQSYNEKLKALYAIEIIAEISGNTIVAALPQIYTCLQAALEIHLLKQPTLRAWKILIRRLEDTHIVTMLDQTIATVVQKWDEFDPNSQSEAEQLISAIFSRSETFKIKHINAFYSLANIDRLATIYAKVLNIMEKYDKPHSLLLDIIRRCKNDNKVVVKQALVDLKRFLKQYQNEFYNIFLSKSSFAPLLSSLLSALLDVLHKFKEIDDICIHSSKCLGLIGALDPAKFEIERKQDQLIIPSDFEDSKDCIRFLIKLLNDYLVPAFWASENPRKQLFLAFAMQESLKFCDLDSSKVDIESLDPNSREYMLWNQFSDIAKSTLTPLSSSKFIASVSSYDPLLYPIFNIRKGHSKWIRELTLDLTKKATKGAGSKIFTICSSLIREQDPSISSFLLPYVTLSVLIHDESGLEVENIEKEIMFVLSTDIDEVHHLATESLKQSYESIFSLLDYFRKWVFSRKELMKRRNIREKDPAVQIVNKLLKRISQTVMAKRSFQSNSHERAILYMEQCIKSDDFGFGNFDALQKSYANIGDYDSLNGVLKVFSTKSLDDRITQLEYSDNWKMAQDCFAALSNFEITASIEPNTRLLKSLFDHNLYHESLEKLESLVDTNSTMMKKEWLDIGLEASVMSGRMNYINDWVKRLELNDRMTDNENLLNYHISKVLMSKNETELMESLERVYLILAGALGLNRGNSLSRNRSSLVLLHAISDLEDIICRNYSNFDNFKALMDSKLNFSSNDFKSSWIISSIRKTANFLSNNPENLLDIAETWIASSKISRKHNRIDLATSSIMNAIGFKNENTDFEYAKLLWAQGDHPRALKFMEELRDDLSKGKGPSLSTRDKAAIQLKYTKWLDFSNNTSSTKIIEEYNAAIAMDQSWEKPYYALGRYHNKLLESKTNNANEKSSIMEFSGDSERRTISYYLRALQCGTKYLYEALPKIVTVWLDFADHVDQVPTDLNDASRTSVSHARKKVLQMILDEIATVSVKLPKYYWYTVFSQLLSRLVHSHKKTSSHIIQISYLVLNEYPSHALWKVLAQYKSNQEDRSKAAKKILELFLSNKDSKHGNANTLNTGKKLFNELIGVCKKPVPKTKGPLSLKDDFNFDLRSVPCPLVVPVESNFDITLPASVQAIKNHNPFPSSSRVTIVRFENRVDVLSSMQQPRHLYIKGSDGRIYGILCKPNDDLRKDAKLMEFTTMISHLLHKDYESEQRKLHIKTYAVVPLNENYGIIEWVDRSRTMRDILRTHYANMNLTLDLPLIKRVLDGDFDIPTKAALFKEKILSKYPPVLHQWFIESFPDPSTWYRARNNYTRTTAVMSMVGYILGLGDRHGENLLFKEDDGGILHVDFDCLFERGLELAVPERVPFRLTANMIDAFGITGVEGTFRKSCEVTLNLLRTNEIILMNILESFLHDPIMDWSRKKSKNTPQTALSTIRRKLRGILDKEGIPMSVQGQAEVLIQQATSLENLCQMYIGWMAFW